MLDAELMPSSGMALAATPRGWCFTIDGHAIPLGDHGTYFSTFGQLQITLMKIGIKPDGIQKIDKVWHRNWKA